MSQNEPKGHLEVLKLWISKNKLQICRYQILRQTEYFNFWVILAHYGSFWFILANSMF